MNDKPRLTISLKRLAPPSADSEPIRKRAKRVLKADDLPKVAPKPKPKPKPKPQARKRPKKPIIAPSILRVRELNDSLNAFAVWREHKPLALGIERQLFQHVAKHRLSASKRVVQLLLSQHTQHPDYLRQLGQSGGRFNLDGSPFMVSFLH